jgi:lipoprotein-anchoring transpeptidase ErfK/SrfK
MYRFHSYLLVIFLGLLTAFPALAAPAANNSSLLAGKIIYDAKSLGGFWYVNPGDFHRYYIGNSSDVYVILRNLSLGVSNVDFTALSANVPDRLKGFFIIKPQDAAKIYYINPINGVLVYVQNPKDAFYLLQSLAIRTSVDLQTIPVGKLVADGSGQEISRSWQYLGWWGGINAAYAPVMAAPSSKAKIVGSFSTKNRVKVIAVKKINGATWDQIDGGRYPGYYVEARYVSPIPQPMPDKIMAVPETVKAGDYWIDLSIGQETLTLFKGNDPILATYVSTGLKGSPTIQGVFNIQYKYVATRMHGGPPFATHYYDLPNVPWTMYYHGSFGVHGAYWHDEFGIPKSAGCTNATIGDSKFIFSLVKPNVGTAASGAATAVNPGTVVYNHY